MCRALATLLSQKGRRVLLIDANPYHPVPESSVTPNSATFFELLSAPRLSESLTKFEDTPYVTIATGDKGNLIVDAKEKLPKLMEELDKHFDHVFFDLPAYGTVRLSGILISLIKDTLLIVKHRGPSNLVIKETCEGIQQDGGNLLGSVMNKYKNYIPKSIDVLI